LVFKFLAIERWKGAWGDLGRREREEGCEKPSFYSWHWKLKVFYLVNSLTACFPSSKKRQKEK